MGTSGSGPQNLGSTTASDSLVLVVVDGITSCTLVIDHFPFTVGRQEDRDLVLTDLKVSEEHAQFVREANEVYLVDQASPHGTYVSGERVTRCKLARNDRVEFGARDAAYVIFNPGQSPAGTARQLLNEVATWRPASGKGSDVDMLNAFLNAARKLNAFGVLDEILHTLLEAVLRRTHAHRAFVFVRQDGALRQIAGRDTKRRKIEEGSTVSRAAANGASTYLATVTNEQGEFIGFKRPYSPERFLCCALCRTVSYDEGAGEDNIRDRPYVAGVVCLDYADQLSSSRSFGFLKEIAEGVTTLVENAALMKAETTSRYVSQELTIAADIQQRLMKRTVPDVPYADVKAVSHPSKDIGGDFFDLVHTHSGLSLVIADVQGKGVAAAVVAATLQGMLYSQLTRDLSLPEMITGVNRFLCDKVIGLRFATLVVARLAPNGDTELMNCGHVPPIIISGNVARTLHEGNFPVGMIPAAQFQVKHLQMSPGDRLLLVTDGVTEAENADGEFFGMERLVACACGGFAAIEHAVTEFCGRTPFSDDCTITELTYRGS